MQGGVSDRAYASTLEEQAKERQRQAGRDYGESHPQEEVVLNSAQALNEEEVCGEDSPKLDSENSL